MSSLKGKIAIVTGSSSGIGAATARLLASEGASVVVNSSKSEEKGRALADELPEAIYVKADVSNEAQCKNLIDETVSKWGRLDVLVNNAGTTNVIPHQDLDAATTEIWERIFRVNVLGAWYLIRAAAPHLRDTGNGCIINVSSLAGLRPAGSSIPYAVSKAALNHLTRLLANVLAPTIRVNAIAPGLIVTPWTEPYAEAHETFGKSVPLGRSGTAEEIAEVCLGVIRASYMTGEVVVADGGAQLLAGTPIVRPRD